MISSQQGGSHISLRRAFSCRNVVLSMYENWARCTKTGQLRSFGKNGIILNIRRSSGQLVYILKVSKWAILKRNFSDYKLKCTKTGQHTVALFTVNFSYLHYNVFERGCEAISG